MNYKQKYNKYKQKYLKLKQYGGSNREDIRKISVLAYDKIIEYMKTTSYNELDERHKKEISDCLNIIRERIKTGELDRELIDSITMIIRYIESINEILIMLQKALEDYNGDHDEKLIQVRKEQEQKIESEIIKCKSKSDNFHDKLLKIIGEYRTRKMYLEEEIKKNEKKYEFFKNEINQFFYLFLFLCQELYKVDNSNTNLNTLIEQLNTEYDEINDFNYEYIIKNKEKLLCLLKTVYPYIKTEIDTDYPKFENIYINYIKKIIKIFNKKRKLKNNLKILKLTYDIKTDDLKPFSELIDYMDIYNLIFRSMNKKYIDNLLDTSELQEYKKLIQPEIDITINELASEFGLTTSQINMYKRRLIKQKIDKEFNDNWFLYIKYLYFNLYERYTEPIDFDY